MTVKNDILALCVYTQHKMKTNSIGCMNNVQNGNRCETIFRLIKIAVFGFWCKPIKIAKCDETKATSK